MMLLTCLPRDSVHDFFYVFYLNGLRTMASGSHRVGKELSTFFSQAHQQ